MNKMNKADAGASFPVADHHGREEATGPNWERFCKELLAERDRLRAELRDLGQERDLYRKALQAALPIEEANFSREEILAQRGNQVSLRHLLTDIERELGS